MVASGSAGSGTVGAMSFKGRTTSTLIAGLVIAAVVGVYYMPQAQQPRQLQGGSKRGQRGAIASGDSVPVLPTPAKLAHLPAYLDALATPKPLNPVTLP